MYHISYIIYHISYIIYIYCIYDHSVLFYLCTALIKTIHELVDLSFVCRDHLYSYFSVSILSSNGGGKPLQIFDMVLLVVVILGSPTGK